MAQWLRMSPADVPRIPFREVAVLKFEFYENKVFATGNKLINIYLKTLFKLLLFIYLFIHLFNKQNWKKLKKSY